LRERRAGWPDHGGHDFCGGRIGMAVGAGYNADRWICDGRWCCLGLGVSRMGAKRTNLEGRDMAFGYGTPLLKTSQRKCSDCCRAEGQTTTVSISWWSELGRRSFTEVGYRQGNKLYERPESRGSGEPSHADRGASRRRRILPHVPGFGQAWRRAKPKS